MVAKGFLEAQVQQLRAWVSAGYSRGRFDVTKGHTQKASAVLKRQCDRTGLRR
jgi:hypothetical protein